MMSNKNLTKLILVVFLASMVYLLPIPEGLSKPAWQLFCVFLGTLGIIILDIFPMGAASIMGITMAIFSKSLTFKDAFVGFTSPITWLILSAFFISFGLIHTGLGKRLAYIFISKIGKSSLGIAYGIAITELILAPGTPASTARTGGIIFPIVESIALSFNSQPNHPSKSRIGSYLVMCLFHISVITSTIFMTAMAANPFSAKLVQSLGYEITWSSWAIYASVPGLINLLLVPIVLYKIFPPELKDTKNAIEIATRELKDLGPMNRNEKLMATGFILLMSLWILGPLIDITAELAALLGLCYLLIFQVVSWPQLLKQHNAFETFIWFGSLLALAQGLSTTGFTAWFGLKMSNYLQHCPKVLGILLLLLIYYYSHYFFASCTAHVSALFLPFLSGALALNAPPLATGLLMCYMSSLMGGLTHYGNGPAPVLFGSGYLDVKQWWRIGFIMSLLSIFCFFVIGSIWWWILGVI